MSDVSEIRRFSSRRNFYTRVIYAIPIPIGFIPIPIPIMSRMAIPIPMGFPSEWDSHGVSHSHAHL